MFCAAVFFYYYYIITVEDAYRVRKILLKTAAAFCLAAVMLSGCGRENTDMTEDSSTASSAEEKTAEDSRIILDSVPKNRVKKKPPVKTAFDYDEEGHIVTDYGRHMPEPENPTAKNGCVNGQAVYLNPDWRYAYESLINSGYAVMYTAPSDRNNIIICVNAGHGTSGSYSAYTYCHPDHTPKVTGGTTSAGSLTAVSVSSGTTMSDGVTEADVNLAVALTLKDLLLDAGYDVLMIRESSDVQLDNVARTVIANNMADCHIAIHLDGDGLPYDKGAFYMSVPDGIKYLDNVAASWQASEALGDCLIAGLSSAGVSIFGGGAMDMDLTQTSYSSIPSVDIELGNQSSDHSEGSIYRWAAGLLTGINMYYGF